MAWRISRPFIQCIPRATAGSSPAETPITPNLRPFAPMFDRPGNCTAWPGHDGNNRRILLSNLRCLIIGRPSAAPHNSAPFNGESLTFSITHILPVACNARRVTGINSGYSRPARSASAACSWLEEGKEGMPERHVASFQYPRRNESCHDAEQEQSQQHQRPYPAGRTVAIVV